MSGVHRYIVFKKIHLILRPFPSITMQRQKDCSVEIKVAEKFRQATAHGTLALLLQLEFNPQQLVEYCYISLNHVNRALIEEPAKALRQHPSITRVCLIKSGLPTLARLKLLIQEGARLLVSFVHLQAIKKHFLILSTCSLEHLLLFLHLRCLLLLRRCFITSTERPGNCSDSTMSDG